LILNPENMPFSLSRPVSRVVLQLEVRLATFRRPCAGDIWILKKALFFQDPQAPGSCWATRKS
jgi:hypothetical protein